MLKVDGHILREFNHENLSEFESECSLLLPFGTEYSLMFKNLESRAAKLRVWIDGEDALGGNAILVHPNRSVDLDGFMNSFGKVTNRFKFIQKTEQIVEHRGDRIDDGMIKVEWTFEKPKPIQVDVFQKNYYDWTWVEPIKYYPYCPPYSPTVTYGNSSNLQSRNIGEASNISYRAVAGASITNCCSNDVPVASCGPLPDEGITVKGSEANQSFVNGYIGELEPNSHVIIIRLKGTFKTSQVKVPIEVKTKIQCTTCGNSVKSGNKFCPNCGTCCVEI
ncbi:MAG: zinc ribbon domain-containing protein [Candidatus Shapirobacteria bacterium]